MRRRARYGRAEADCRRGRRPAAGGGGVDPPERGNDHDDPARTAARATASRRSRRPVAGRRLMATAQQAAVPSTSPRARNPGGRRSGGDDSSPATGSLQRARAMARLREQGQSLDEIALGFGVSRERVRQILQANGGPDSQHVADARRRRAEQHAQARIEELLELWRAGEAPRSAASALGLQAAACRKAIARCATEFDRAARKASLARARAVAKTYSDDDIAAAVASVAVSLGRVPSAKEYEALARARRLSQPRDRAQPDGRLDERRSRRRSDPGRHACAHTLAALDRRGLLGRRAPRRHGAGGDPDGHDVRPSRRRPAGPALVGDGAQPPGPLERDHGSAGGGAPARRHGRWPGRRRPALGRRRAPARARRSGRH